jgi:hypothetical protein
MFTDIFPVIFIYFRGNSVSKQVQFRFSQYKDIFYTSIPKYFIPMYKTTADTVAAPSQAWVCGHSIAGIVVSNLSEGMEVCHLWVFYYY